MRFLADMGVAMRIAQWLREQGHQVVHLRKENLHRMPDVDVFRKAATEGRILLTFDLDFAEIVALSGAKKRQRSVVSPAQYAHFSRDRAAQERAA
jgi:predicted nuclease of predicted toxin-antitoxin system